MTEPGDPRAVLAAARQRALARLASLEREFGGIVEAAQGAGTDDEHDPEGATLAFERQHLAALAQAAREHLADIDVALARLADRSHWTCQACGQPSRAEPLPAGPAA